MRRNLNLKSASGSVPDRVTRHKRRIMLFLYVDVRILGGGSLLRKFTPSRLDLFVRSRAQTKSWIPAVAGMTDRVMGG